MAERKASSGKPVSDWLNRPFAAYTVHAERQRQLFDALNAVVTAHGSWIISPPGQRCVRIEALPHSSLMIRLAEAGHKIGYITAGTRITPAGIMTTDIFELTLPR
jgi:hypothetical protein